MLSENQLKEYTEKYNKREVMAIGIDQGYANLGYCVMRLNLTSNHYKIEELGTIKTCSTEEMNKRLLSIYNSINNILNKYEDIKIAGCERLFHNKPMTENFFQQRNKSASIMKTNMVTGVIYLLCGEKDINISDFPPTTVKKYLTNNGKSDKKELEEAINSFAVNNGLEIKTNHEADAIAIAITVINNYIETQLYGEIKQTKKVKKRKKDYIESNSKIHTLNKLYISQYRIKLKEERNKIDCFLEKYSREHKLKKFSKKGVLINE